MARGVIFFSLRATAGFRKNVLKVFGGFSFFFLFGRARSRKFDFFACFLAFLCAFLRFSHFRLPPRKFGRGAKWQSTFLKF